MASQLCAKALDAKSGHRVFDLCSAPGGKAYSVAEFMKMTNEFYKDKVINKAEYKTFLQLLNPFAPHMTEELWSILGNDNSETSL